MTAIATEDIDIVVEIFHYDEYAAIEAKLRSKGFANDVTSGVICRYIVQGIMVDVMPTSENILGFSNKWYPEAFVEWVSAHLDHTEQKRVGFIWAVCQNL
ncbi:MAG TPA: hypothetical protein VGM31_08750 [Puia sp.]